LLGERGPDDRGEFQLILDDENLVFDI